MITEAKTNNNLSVKFHFLFEATNQSGITPRNLSPQIPPSIPAQQRRKLYDYYEKESLKGFGTSDLYDCGAIDPYNLVTGECTLTNEIHPIFR